MAASSHSSRAVSFLLGALLAIPGPAVAQTCLSNWGSPIAFVMDRPHGTAVGDWNGDGKLDFAVAYSSHVVIVLGTGTTPLSSSSFLPLISVPVLAGPFAVTPADINNDGILDLVTANSDGTVAVLLGRGTSDVNAFAAPIYFPAGVRAFDVVAGDFDDDGRLDLAVSENDCSTGGVIVLMALPPLVPGQPRFAPPAKRILGCNGAAITTADFNSDHRPDLAIAMYGPGNLQVLLGLGGGAFSSPITVASGLSGAFDVRAGDVDKDGIVDLVSTCLTGTRVHWGLGSGGAGDGTFSAGMLLLAGNSASVAIGDQDGDGDFDLAFETGGVLRLFFQTGSRVFAPTSDVLNLSTSFGARFADFDRDGRADLLLGQYSSAVADVIPSLCVTPPPAPIPPSPDPGGASWDIQGKAIAPVAADQGNATIVADGSGGVFVVWLESSHVRAQHVSAQGQRMWNAGGIDLCPVAQAQSIPIAISDGAGGMYVAWIHDPTGGRRVRVIRMLATGVPATGWPSYGLEVSSTAQLNASALPRLASDGAGGVFVADLEAATAGVVRVYRLTASGAPAPGWPQGTAVAFGPSGGGTSGVLTSNDVVANGNGGLTSMYSYTFTTSDPCCSSGSNTGISRMKNTGTVNGTVFIPGGSATLNALANGQALVSYPAGDGTLHGVGLSSDAVALWDQSVGPNASGTLPRAVPDGSGGAFLLWDATGSQGADVFGSRRTSNGTPATGWTTSPKTLVSQPGTQREAWPAYDGTGGLLFVWRDERSGDPDVYFGRVDGSGNPVIGWPSDGLALVSMSGAQRRPLILLSDPVTAIAVWEDLRNGTAQLYAQRIVLDQPVAALASVELLSSTPTRTTLRWQLTGLSEVVRVERCERADEWVVQDRATFTGDGLHEWADELVLAGRHLGYRLVGTSSGSTIPGSEVWVDAPTELSLALKGFDSNPAAKGAAVSFTLPVARPAQLQIFDVTGREVISREVGSLGAGRHRIEIGALPVGFYLVRLSQAGESRVQRGIVLR